MSKQSARRPRGRPPKVELTPEVCQQILAGLREGRNRSSIAEEIGVPHSTLIWWLQHHAKGFASEKERERKRSREQFQREAERALREARKRKHVITVDDLQAHERRTQADMLAYLERSANEPKRKHPWMP